MSHLIHIGGRLGIVSRNVVFVHGLGGDAYRTWQMNAQTFWPVWIGEDVPGSDVFTLSYPAPLSNWLGTAMALPDRARNVLELLRSEDFHGAPITFVCHSLGGLLVKQMLLDLARESDANPNSRRLLNQIDQIVFLATPHTGSYRASLMQSLSLLAWPSATATNLVANDPALRKLNVDYREFSRQRSTHLQHLVLFETIGTAAGTIVDPGSSDPGLVAAPIAVDADHLSISKPRSRASFVYARVRNFVSAATHGQTADAFAVSVWPTIEVHRSWNILPKILRVCFLVLIAFALFSAYRLTFEHQQQQADKVENLAVVLGALNERVARISQATGVPLATLSAILAKFADFGTNEDEIIAKLERKASEYLELKHRLARVDGQKARQLRLQAQEQLDQGRLDEAERIIDSAAVDQQDQNEKTSRLAAELLVDQAKMKVLALKYDHAAERYDKAAQTVWFDKPLKRKHVELQIDTLMKWYDDVGDPVPLKRVVILTGDWRNHPDAEGDVEFKQRLRWSWGMAMNYLAMKENDPEKLKSVIADLEDQLTAIDKITRKDRWYSIVKNLAQMTANMARLSSDFSHFDRAIEILRKGLKDIDPRQEREAWIALAHSLALTLTDQGQVSKRPELIQEALGLLRQEVVLLSKKDDLEQWTRAQLTLGYTLQAVWQSKTGVPPELDEAVSVLRLARAETPKDRRSMGTEISYRLGTALVERGVRFIGRDSESALKNFADAEDALEGSMQDTSRAHPAQVYARLLLGQAYWNVGVLKKDTAKLEQSLSFNNATLQASGQLSPNIKALLFYRLADASYRIAILTGHNMERLRQACQWYRAAYDSAEQSFAVTTAEQVRDACGVLGIMYFQVGEFDKAEIELQRSSVSAPSAWNLWLFLAKARQGRIVNEDIAANAAATGENAWIADVTNMLAGRILPSELLATADDKTRCDFEFYAAEFLLIQGEKTNAFQGFQKAKESCKGYLEGRVAEAEIARF